MPDTLGTYLYRRRTQLALVGNKRFNQDEMATHLSAKLTEMLGREITITRRTYSKYENDRIACKYEPEIRQILA